MAPVGPETWTFEPPRTAATNPATTAVMRPDRAPMPDVIPNPRASGSATTATVSPATTSPQQLPHRPLTVGEHLEDADPGRMGERLEQLGLELGDRTAGPRQTVERAVRTRHHPDDSVNSQICQLINCHD